MILTAIGKSAPRQKGARMHSHMDWELIYNIEGCGTMQVGGETYSFEPDTVLLCPPLVEHDKRPEESFSDIYMCLKEVCLYSFLFTFPAILKRAIQYVIYQSFIGIKQ